MHLNLKKLTKPESIPEGLVLLHLDTLQWLRDQNDLKQFS